MKSSRLPLLALALAAACEADPSVQVVARPPAPDAAPTAPPGDIWRPDFQPFDAAPPPDAAPDLVSLDAAGDVPDRGATDARPADAAPDLPIPDMALVSTPPLPTQVAVLPQANETWVAWVRNGRLIRRCLVNANCQAPVEVAEVGASQVPLRAGSSGRGIPWVVANDPVTGEAIAYDIKTLVDGRATAFPLSLYGPVVMGVTGKVNTEVVAIGRLAADDPQLGWRRMSNERASALKPIHNDYRGFPLPLGVVTTTKGAVFGFPTGECLWLENQAAPDRVEPGATWACGFGPNDVLGGDDLGLYIAARDVPSQRVLLRRATPGHVDDGLDPAARVELPGIVETWNTDYPRFNGGGVFRVDGVGQTSFWVLKKDEAARFIVADPALVLGVAPVGDAYHRLDWDPVAGTVTSTPVEADATAIPPGYVKPAGCVAVGPETCDAADDNCNGEVDENLCCTGNGGTKVTDGVPERARMDQIDGVGITDDGLVYIVRQGEDIAVLGYRPDNVERSALRERGRWTGYQRLLRSTTVQSNVLVIAEALPPPPPPDMGVPPPVDAAAAPADAAAPPVDAGAPADAAPPVPDAMPSAPPGRIDMLWLQAGVPLDPVAPPCDPILHVRFLPAADAVRIYCQDHAVDVAVGAADGTRLEYPRGEAVRWISRGVFGDGDLDLVARGEGHELLFWRDDAAGIAAVEDAILPTNLNNLLPAERTLPIHIPAVADATPVRVGPDGGLEALLANGLAGWTPLSGTYRPLKTLVSNTEPVAYTLGRTSNENLAQVNVALFVHDLRRGGQPWGVALELGDASDLGENQFHDIALAVYPPRPAQPNVPRVFRVYGGQLSLQGFSLFCNPP